jgi:hypothetical protein
VGLPQDLLAQAEHLARRDRRKPKQANLRRAVSSAYYALFHLLVQDSSGMMISGNAQRELRNLVRRAYDHGDMRAAAQRFATPSSFPPHLRSVVKGSIPPELSRVAQTFADLQEERHRADYSMTTRLTRQQTVVQVRRVHRAFQEWKSIRATSEARVFMAALLLGKRWNR